VKRIFNLNSKSVLAAIIYRYSSNLVFQFSGFLVAMVVSKILGPELLGYYAILNIIKNYLSYTNLGTTNGLTWSLGISLGGGNNEAAHSTIKTAITFHFILPLVFALAIVAGGLLLNLEYPLNLIVPAAGIIGFIDLYTVNLSRILGAMERHKLLAQVMLIKSLLSIVLVVSLTYIFSVEGRILAALLLGLLVASVYHVNLKHKLGFQWDKQKLKELIAVGFPIMAAGFLHANFFLVDRIIITGFLPVEDLGMYAFGFYLVSVVKTIKGTVSTVIYQRQNHIFGKEGPGNTAQLFALSKSSSYLVTDVTGIVSGLALIVFTYAVLFFMPEYTMALNITYIVVFSQAIGSINVLNTIRKNYLYLGILSFSLLFNVILGIILVRNYELTGVAYATLIAFILHNCIVNYVNLRYFKKSLFATIMIVARIVIVPVIIFIIAFFIRFSIDNTFTGESFFSELLWMFGYLAGFLIVAIPLMIMVKKHLQLLNTLKTS
jgi:O-antigen/teichoic acid export membrane protein